MLNNRFILILLLALTIFGYATAQETEKETVRYDYSFEFKNGVYTSFYSFRNNSPIPFSRFVSPAYDDDFFKKLLKVETISFYDENGTLNEIPRKLIWGYANNGKANSSGATQTTENQTFTGTTNFTSYHTSEQFRILFQQNSSPIT